MKKPKYVIIGILVLATLLILSWGINYLKGKNFFKKESIYFVVYNNINQLEEARPVTFNGFQVGLVKDLYLHPDNTGRIIVSFFLTNEKFYLKKTALARIYSMDLMGSRGIELISGNSDENHISGDTLIAAMEGDLVDKVSSEILPVKLKAENLMASIDSVMAVIQYVFNEDSRKNIANSFESIKFTLKNLENTSIKLDTIVREESTKLARIFANIDTITTNISTYNKRLTSIIDNIQTITDSLARAQIKTLILETGFVMNEIKTMISEINSGKGSLGKLIENDSLYNSLTEASDNLDRLIKDIYLNPKRYLHFSAIDLGKTVVVSNDPVNELLKEEDVSEYSVLIFSSKQAFPPNDPVFQGVSGIEELYQDGKYFYTLGKQTKMKRIKKEYLKQIIIFPEAKIVSIKNGKVNKIF